MAISINKCTPSEASLRYAAIVESSNDAIIGKTLEGVITSWNPAAERIFGFSEAEMIGQHVSNILPSDKYAEEEMILGRIAAGEKIQQFESTRKKKDGSIIRVSLSISPIKLEDGTIIGASTTARDTTDIDAAEQKNAMLAAIIDSSEDAIISKDLNGIVSTWNKAAERIFGFTEKEIVGKHITAIIPKNLLHEETEIIGRVKEGSKIEHYETIRMRKDGSLVHVSLTVSPIRDSKGKVIGVSKIARDTTTQIESKEKNARLAAIVNSSDDAIVSKDLDGYVTSWNKGAEQVFGYREEEMIGEHITIVIPKERHYEEDLILSKIRNGERIQQMHTIRQRKDGSQIHVSLTISPIRDDVNRIIGISKIARNITDLVMSQQKLEAYTQELKRLNTHKDEFISMASHELNTPLTSLRVYLQMLKENVQKPGDDVTTRVTYTTKALNLTDKLGKLIGDLLNVSKIEAGKLHMHTQQFDFQALLQEVLDSMRAITKKHTIVFSGFNDSLLVWGDKDRLEQVVVNLLSNAIKYSPKADKILVDLQKHDDKLALSITDYGIGIPANQMHRIFSRFFRAEGLSPSFSGLGIGLYLSHQIVIRHNGTMRVQSEEGKGSTFTVELPLT